MNEALTAKQKDALWTLLAQGGQGKAPPKATREALLAARLISPGYSGRTALVEVTDAGWDWADRHLGAEDATSVKALGPWLQRIRIYLDAKGLGLAALFPVVPEPLSPTPVKPPPRPRAPPKPKATPKPKAPAPKPKSLSETQLRNRIRTAYLAVTEGRTARRALLVDLRAQLRDIDRATLDEALTRLHEKDKTMTLMHLDNPKEVTTAVREAQIMFKGAPLHLLWVDE